MTQNTKLKCKPEDADKCASIWFVRLERALADHDELEATYAKGRLQRLGVRVTFDDLSLLGIEGGTA